MKHTLEKSLRKRFRDIYTKADKDLNNSEDLERKTMEFL